MHALTCIHAYTQYTHAFEEKKRQKKVKWHVFCRMVANEKRGHFELKNMK